MYKSDPAHNNRRNVMIMYRGQQNQKEAEAASKAIEKTIQGMENRIGVKFRRGSTPSESREIMYEGIAILVRGRNKR